MSTSDAGQATDNADSVTESSTTPAERRTLLATCVMGAVRAAKIVREGSARRSTLAWEHKGQFDYVSEIDRSSEAVLAEVVNSRHSEATFLAEEGSPDAQASSGLVFVVDPLDGTTNFLHGVPWYAVSIAALVDGIVVAGAVINVVTGDLCTATLGGGARLAGEPIHVSETSDPARALIATGFPFSRDDEIDRYVPMLPAIMRATAGIRRAGAAALDLADVACGRYDAFFELRLSPWDLAAGVLLIREAGGVVTTVDGAPCRIAQTSILAGNPAMHSWLLSTLHS